MHLTDDDVKLLDDYFQLLCRRMRDPSLVSSVKKVKKYKSNKYRQATGQE